jgi:hypothetical protein
MANKFYQFDYAEMNGFEIQNMGILNVALGASISKEVLRDYARQHLKNPSANIVISNISKLTQAEFELVTNKKA